MIPRCVHRIWIGDDPEPEWTRSFAESWQQPGWELRQWSGPEELYPLANQAVYDEADSIAGERAGQLRSDVLRYEILARCGGIYVDTDTECLRTIDDLLDGVSCFAAWESYPRWVGNTYLGSVAGHPFLEVLIERLPHNVRRRAGATPARLTGPQYLSRIYRARNDLVVFPQVLFYPFGWEEVEDFRPGEFDPAERFPRARAIHWWHNRRRISGLLPVS